MVELKNGSFVHVENVEELINDIVRVTCGYDVADKLTEYIEDIKNESYTCEEYQELEAEKDKLKAEKYKLETEKYKLEEENEILNAEIETYKNGGDPFENQLNEIQYKLLWLSQDVADLKRISKSKKLEEARVSILQNIEKLNNMIEKMK